MGNAKAQMMKMKENIESEMEKTKVLFKQYEIEKGTVNLQKLEDTISSFERAAGNLKIKKSQREEMNKVHLLLLLT